MHFKGTSKGKGAQWEKQHFTFLLFLFIVSYDIYDSSIETAN